VRRCVASRAESLYFVSLQSSFSCQFLLFEHDVAFTHLEQVKQP
jgi:hypothetical protein